MRRLPASTEVGEAVRNELGSVLKNIASLSAETGSAAQLSSAEHQAATADAAIL